MPNVIGPNFGNEVIAAGLGGLPFTWGSDGSIGNRQALTPEQNTALDAVIAAHDPEKPEVPNSVSPLQARLALEQMSALAQIEAYVSSQSSAVQIAWNHAREIRRDNAMIAAGAAALSWTPQQIDELFILAASL